MAHNHATAASLIVCLLVAFLAVAARREALRQHLAGEAAAVRPSPGVGRRREEGAKEPNGRRIQWRLARPVKALVHVAGADEIRHDVPGGSF